MNQISSWGREEELCGSPQAMASCGPKVRGMEICKDSLQREMNLEESRGSEGVFISAGEVQAVASSFTPLDN